MDHLQDKVKELESIIDKQHKQLELYAMALHGLKQSKGVDLVQLNVHLLNTHHKN